MSLIRITFKCDKLMVNMLHYLFEEILNIFLNINRCMMYEYNSNFKAKQNVFPPIATLFLLVALFDPIVLRHFHFALISYIIVFFFFLIICNFHCRREMYT